MGLALDIGLRGFPLGIEGIELLLQPVLGRDPGIDRAAEGLLRLGAHLAARSGGSVVVPTFDFGRKRGGTCCAKPSSVGPVKTSGVLLSDKMIDMSRWLTTAQAH